MPEAYIVAAARTAGGKRGGKLAAWHPVDLAAEALDAVVERAGLDGGRVDDVILGCVTQAGEQSFAFGRNAVLASRRLPEHVPAVTIDRQCGSSQQAIQFAAQAVMSGTQDIVIAAGAESMTRVPMFSNATLHQQAGLGIGPLSGRVKDRYSVEAFSQFDGAEMVARKYGFDRAMLDRFALESHRRAEAATAAGAFGDEIVPLTLASGDIHSVDEGIRFGATLDGIASVRLLREDGVISAANASQICDGASAVMIVGERALKDHGLTPLARIVNLSVTAGDPVIMLDEPIAATRRALDRAGMTLDQIDLYEVNEAFAPVPLAWLQQLDGDPLKLNVHGGAIALGHHRQPAPSGQRLHTA